MAYTTGGPLTSRPGRNSGGNAYLGAADATLFKPKVGQDEHGTNSKQYWAGGYLHLWKTKSI